MVSRKVVTLPEVRNYVAQFDAPFAYNPNNGIAALVSISNMGYCKDGVTKWYTFNLDNVPCIFFKR